MSNPIIALANVRRRLAKLKPERPYVDCGPFVVPVIEAMFKGRPFEWLPTPDVEPSNKQKRLLALRMSELDRIAERLEAEDPGGAECFQRDVERKRQANLLALEREESAREAQGA